MIIKHRTHPQTYRYKFHIFFAALIMAVLSLTMPSHATEPPAIYVLTEDAKAVLSEQQISNFKSVTEATIIATRKLLPTLASSIRITVNVIDRDLLVVSGVTGHADRANEIVISLSSIYPGGIDQAIEDGLATTLFHELHHTVRGWTLQDNKFGPGIDIAIINEGLADVFAEIQSQQPPFNYPDKPDFNAWTREILALPKDANYGEWMFQHPDGRIAIGYRTGVWLVKRAMQSSGADILALSKLSVEEIYKHAGY